jgi:hypothetical protein
MICPKCSTENAMYTPFCKKCGTPLSSTSAPSSPASGSHQKPTSDIEEGKTEKRFLMIGELLLIIIFALFMLFVGIPTLGIAWIIGVVATYKWLKSWNDRHHVF